MRRSLRQFAISIQQFSLLLYIFLGLSLLLIDQATKLLAYAGEFGSFLNYFEPIFSKNIFPNYDFAFSIKVPNPIIWVIYAALLAILLIWFFNEKKRSGRMKLAMVLILSGALSNILDRAVLGFVRDFIHIFWGNSFNIADIYIVAGIVLMIRE